MKYTMQWLIPIVILAASFLAQAQSHEPEIADHFAYDWTIQSKDAVVYSRTFDQPRKFSYTSCDTSDNYCNVTLSSTTSSGPTDSKTCRFGLDRHFAPEVGISSLLLSTNDRMTDRVIVAWYRKAQDHFDPFVVFLNMTDCKTNTDAFVGSIYNYRKPPPLLMYRSELLAIAVTRNNRRIIRKLSFEKTPVKDEHSQYIRVNHTWTGEEQPVEVDSTQGFFFMATDGESDRKLDLMYANVTTGEVSALGSIERDSAHIYAQTSGSHGKYGLCWKKFAKDDRINCTQLEVGGSRSIDQVSLQLSEPIDWFAVHNLNEAAMLLVSGQCRDKKCYQFSVVKVHADASKSSPLLLKNLNAECPEAPFSLTMDVVEHPDEKLICFHFVCLNNKYQDQSVEKTSTTGQYRRNCLSLNDIANMN